MVQHPFEKVLLVGKPLHGDLPGVERFVGLSEIGHPTLWSGLDELNTADVEGRLGNASGASECEN